MKTLRWLADHWYLPLLALAFVLGWALNRGQGRSPAQGLRRELDAIDAAATARRDVAERGLSKARFAVKRRHSEDMAALDLKQHKRAKELSSDPVKLAKFLVRAAR